MTYEELIWRVAKEHNTTPAEVDREIRVAIKDAKLEIEPSELITLCTNKIKKDYIS